MKRVLIFIIAAISALACSEREMTEEVKPGHVRYARHSFEMSFPSKDSTATRSIMKADPDEIKEICAFAFDAASGDILRYRSKIDGMDVGDPVTAYVSGSSSFEWSLPLGVEMDIYAVCNMGHPSTPETLSEFLDSPDLVYEINNVSDLNDSGIPMTAVLEGIKSDIETTTYTLPARRIVSKYTVRLSEMPSDYEITGIRICNVNSHTTLFAENEAADASSRLIMGDWATEEDLKILNSGGRAEFHMFENAQTTAGGVHLESGSKWFEVHGLLAEKADLCTYLDIISEHNGESRRDRMYLGRNCTDNFDVKRNTIRHITCPAPVSLISGAGQDVLRFTGSRNAAPGETVEIPFVYNLALSGADPSSIAFSADEGLALGKPVFSSGENGYGTGILPVTCSPSVSIGDRLSVSMVSGDASAETEVEIINKVVSVTISTPLTQIRVRSVQLQAEAVYADGTIVTDPTLFDWKIATGSARATVQDGLVSRIGYKYGSVVITAELEGVTSNKLALSFSSTILEMFSEPDEVYVSEGNSTTLALYYRISQIGNSTGTNVTVSSNGVVKASSTSYAMNDADIASASGETSGEFRITGKKNGITSLGIQYNHVIMNLDYGIATLDVPVIVGDYQYELELSRASLSLPVGSSVQLEAFFVTYFKGIEESRINVTDEAEWASSHSGNIKVTNGFVEAVKAVTSGNAAIYASYNGYSAEARVKAYDVVTYELAIEPSAVYLAAGEGEQLSAILYSVSNGIHSPGEDVTPETSWSSGDPDVATVSTTGFLRGISQGSTHVYAEYGDYLVSIPVEVSDDSEYSTGLEITPPSANIEIGSSVDLKASHITYINGFPNNHEDVTDWNVCFWTSSNPSVATVSAGRVTGISEGIVTITASYGGDMATAAIRVSSTAQEPVITYDLVVSAGQTEFIGGGSTTAKAIYITYADGVETASADVTSSASWSSGNTSVATVNGGSISVKNVDGSASITASYGGKSGSVTITASKKEEQDPEPVMTYGLTVSAGKTVFNGGGTTAVTATYVTYSDGVETSSKDVTSSATWSSDNTSVATVSGGIITVLDVTGTAEIEAEYNGESDAITIIAHKEDDPMPDPVITYELIVATDKTIFTGGGSGTATATYITYTDGIETSSEDVTSYASWSSSDNDVASVSRGSISVGNVDGSAVIIASYKGKSDAVTITAKKKVITYGLEVTISENTFEGGGYATANAIYITYTNDVQTSSEDVTSSAVWSTSDPGVATVSDGNITVMNIDGVATITATYNGYSDSEVISATKVVETHMLVLDPSSVTISAGGNSSMKALYLTYRNGSRHSSEDVTSSASWSSSNSSVVGVNKGLLIGYKAGSASVTASYNGSSVSGTVTVNPVASLSVGWSDTEMYAGSTKVQSLIYDPGDGSAVSDVSASASWKSSNSSVATINGGIVTALSAGTATLTGTYKGLSASCTVTVTNPQVSVINTRHVSSDGTNYTICLDITMSDGNVLQDVDYSWTCTSSSDSSVMSVGRTGDGPISYRAGSDGSYNFRLVTTDKYNAGGKIQNVASTANGVKASAFY